jgi:adenosylcobinamide-phosphate synthase
MTFFSIFVVLVIEQLKAAPAARVQEWLDAYARFLERQFNGGERRHGVTAWGVGVAIPALCVLGMQIGLDRVNALLTLLFSVAMLYFLMGFRQFSHFFTDIQLALRAGEIEHARTLFHAWTGRENSRLSTSEIVRLTIEHGILASHRHVFAPLFWFMLLGPAGALLYRLSVVMNQPDAGPIPAEPGFVVPSDAFGEFARLAFEFLDWLPARLTAVTFAIVGDFEDAIYCWRTQAQQWQDAAAGILLASGAGALGVKLGQPLPETLGIEERPELGIGDEADIDHLQSAIGLVWRALVLCLLMLVLLTLASWVGS